MTDVRRSINNNQKFIMYIAPSLVLGEAPITASIYKDKELNSMHIVGLIYS